MINGWTIIFLSRFEQNTRGKDDFAEASKHSAKYKSDFDGLTRLFSNPLPAKFLDTSAKLFLPYTM